MTLGALLADLYRRLNYPTAPAAAVTARLTAFVNQAHRQILTRPSLGRLRDDTITFASVANQAVYALPSALAKVQHIQDRFGNQFLTERSLTWLRQVDPGLTNVGDPASVYVQRGLQQVQRQPSAPGALWVVGTTAADVTQKVMIETIVAGGYTYTLPLPGPTLAGMVRVQLGARGDHIEVVKFYLDAAASSDVVLYDAAVGGIELARIEPGKLYARYQAIQLWPTPASVVTYHVDYTRTIPDMTQPTDEPLLPEDFHQILVDGALVKEWTKKTDASRREAALRDFNQGMDELTAWVLVNSDSVASLRPVGVGMSQLGPSYPSGS